MPTSDDQNPSPFTSKSFILSAVVVGAILIAGGIAITANLVGTSDQSPTAEPSASAGPHVTSADESRCGLEGFDAEGTLTEAPTTNWELVGAIAAPTDPSGPGPGIEEDDGFRECYAHTPTGALYAAANFFAVASVPSLRGQGATLIQAGPGREASEETVAESPDVAGPRVQFAGFKLMEYSGKSATVDLVVRTPQGELISIIYEVVWDEGDWKIVATETGESPFSSTKLSNLGGYHPWSGA